MKPILALAVFAIGISSLSAQTTASTKKDAKSGTTSTATTDKSKTATTSATTDPGYKFDQVVHDYGTIKKGADPYCEFKLTNTSKQPLVIKEAKGSCGCTVPEYPKEPIMPGKSVTIKVRYDTNRVGPFEKQVTVTFEGKDTPAVLKIKGVVEATPAETPFPGPGQQTPSNGAPVNNGGGY